MAIIDKYISHITPLDSPDTYKIKAYLLKNGRTFKVKLDSTNASTAFDGSSDIADIGVSGILGTANGGTGNNLFTKDTLIYADTNTKLASYTSTNGGAKKLWYLNAGVPTDSTETVGATDKPVFLSSGTITASTSTIGSGIIPIYMASGQIKASTSTVGNGEQPVYLNSGTITKTTYYLKANIEDGSANHLAYYSTARTIDYTPKIYYINSLASAAEVPINMQGLRIIGGAVGNDSSSKKTTISGTTGLLSYGDGGPQIQFSTSEKLDDRTTSGAQSGALIFTDHDAAATGASWHFVSNQGDWNVISKRFHARTGISIGTNLPNTSYNFYVNGTSYFNGNTTHNGIDYFANGTTYYINNSGTGNLNALTVNNTTASTTTGTGGLIVKGGAGIAGRVTASEFNATRPMIINAGKVYSNISGNNVLLPAKTTMLFSNGIAIANPGLTSAADVGWLRVTGTAETDTALELATGDDGGAGETIHARQYNTSNTIVNDLTLLDTKGNTLIPNSLRVNKGISKTEAQNKTHIISPGGGSYATSTSTVTGALKIQLPVSWTSCMLNFSVDIYDYAVSRLVTYHIGGYNYNSSSDKRWVSTSAYSNGTGNKSNLTVRFGHDGTHCCVIIGETNTSWSYPQVNVRDVYLGYSDQTIGNWETGWAISFITTLPTITGTTITSPNRVLDGTKNRLAYYSAAGTISQTGSDLYTDGSNLYATGGHNFITVSNEFNFIPDGFSNHLWFNYETVTRKNNGNVTAYIFGNGKHGELARITLGQFSGNAATATMPLGFSSRGTNAIWGNQIGATVTSWNESGGGSVDWRQNNPQTGQLSMKIDGTVYINEGQYPVLAQKNANGYPGFLITANTTNHSTSAYGGGWNDTGWLRTTSNGFIPYQAGGAGSGHSSLGTSSWYFKTAYIDEIHGSLTGNASSATAFSSNATVTLTGDTTGTSAGSTKSWSVPTVTSALTAKGGRVATADSAHAAADYSKMYLRIATDSMKTNKPKFSIEGETTAVHDGHILEFHWDNSGAYNEQLALSNSKPAISVRAQPNGTWSAWTPVLTSINTKWVAWGAGTTAGPTAKLNIGGTTITSAAIPSASTGASGIVTTDAQQFKGRKKFGYLELYGEDAGTAKRYLDIIGRNNAGTMVAEIYYDFGNATNITTGQWSFSQWSPNSTANTATSGGYETYSLPTVTSGLSSGNHGYSILTTKNTVTVRQGGTGNTSYTASKLIYSKTATQLASGNIVSEGNYISNVTYLSVNAGHQTNYRLYVNGTSYLANNLYINAVGSNYGIYAVGTKATYRMIRFIDNTGDIYGNGIVIGGGGLTILGSGESGDTLYSNLGYTGGSEITVIGSDGEIAFYPDNNSYDASAKLSMTASRFWAGVNGNTTREAQVGVQSGAGQLYMYSVASTAGSKGIYFNAHGDSPSGYIAHVDSAHRVYYNNNFTSQRVKLIASQSSQINSGVWLRTCIVQSYQNYANFQIRLTGGWSTGSPTVATIDVNMRNGLASMKLVHRGFLGVIGKVKLVKLETNTAYLDVYIREASKNTDYFGQFIGNVTVTQNDNTTHGTTNITTTDVDGLATLDLTAGVGNASTPVYIGADGKPVACTAYGSASVTSATTATRVGNGDIYLYANNSNEINFGGSNTSSTIYFGYRATDSRPKPTEFVFGSKSGNYGSAIVRASQVWGAVWNDYAELRKSEAKTEEKPSPGRVVKENGNDALVKTDKRLERGCYIISDTFGFAIGENIEPSLPVAVSGRVLAYPYESREEFKNHIGWPVCSGPSGTVSIMTEEEEMKYPSRIIGTISAVPDYEIWHGGADVVVDGRVWIKVR